MWTDDQLDNADYVNLKNADGGQLLNACTIEVQGSAFQGPFLMHPAPPFGSLKNGGNSVIAGAYLGGVRIPTKRYSEALVPKSIYAQQANDTIIHQFPADV